MAVSKVALRIIERAVKIRVDQGENLDEILLSYPKLSDEQINELREKLKEQ